MQTEGDRNRVIEMGASPGRTRVTGNLKFDQPLPPWAPEDQTALISSLGLTEKETLFVAGSTHSGEEEILIDLFRELNPGMPNLRLLLAPRHLDRLEEVEKILKRDNLPWIRKTSLAERENLSVISSSAFPPVILLDTMGELMRVYRLASVVFIGGSLVPVGGHNPLEPLLFKKCVLFGPHMFNFSEIVNRLITEGGAIQVGGKGDLLSSLKRLLHEPKTREEVGERGYRFLQAHRGATERMMKEIRPYLHQIKSGAADR
jgi:3-deoxy-D-manno-octulosonic-acid transferase